VPGADQARRHTRPCLLQATPDVGVDDAWGVKPLPLGPEPFLLTRESGTGLFLGQRRRAASRDEKRIGRVAGVLSIAAHVAAGKAGTLVDLLSS
jgi:hypothetical protein